MIKGNRYFIQSFNGAIIFAPVMSVQRKNFWQQGRHSPTSVLRSFLARSAFLKIKRYRQKIVNKCPDINLEQRNERRIRNLDAFLSD